MKKMFVFLILGMFLFSMTGIVSALDGGKNGPLDAIQGVIEDIYEIFEPTLSKIIGETGESALFLPKILFLIIIFSIVWKSLERIPFFEETTWILWSVSAGASILAIRWFGNSDIVNTVLLPYSVLGITLTAGIPFVLYFLIVKDFPKTLRKTSWVFFIVIFIGLWFMRSGAGELAVGDFAYIYLATAGLAFLVLMYDGTIQKWKIKIESEKSHAPKIKKRIDDLEFEKDDLNTKYASEGDRYRSRYTAKRRASGWKADIDLLDLKIAELESRL